MDRFDPQRRQFAVGLALLAGFVDAAGFVQVDGYYVSFMTGNTTLLALDVISGARRVLVPAMLIAGFVLGVALGTWIGDRSRYHRKRWVLGLVTLLLVCAAGARAQALQIVSMGCLVLAMGALNATLSGNRPNPVGLTYMTGALVRLGQTLGDRMSGKSSPGWVPFALLWCGLLVGAIIGGTAATKLPAAALWMAAGYAGLLILLSGRLTGEPVR